METDVQSSNDSLKAEYDKLLIEIEWIRWQLKPSQDVVAGFNAANRAYSTSELGQQPPSPLDPLFLRDFWALVDQRDRLLAKQHRMKRLMVQSGLMQEESLAPTATTESAPSLLSVREKAGTCAESKIGDGTKPELAASWSDITGEEDYHRFLYSISRPFQAEPGFVDCSTPPSPTGSACSGRLSVASTLVDGRPSSSCSKRDDRSRRSSISTLASATDVQEWNEKVKKSL
jgi:hypothetical protein